MTDNQILKHFEAERQACEVWTRVMGYFRPFSGFNIGKKAEFEERKTFIEPNFERGA